MDAASSFTYLQSLIKHSPIAIAVLDGEHRFRLCNPAFMDLFQYRPEDLAAFGLDFLIAAPDCLNEAARMSREVLAGKKVHAVTQRRRKDGMAIDVEIYGIPLLFDGEVEGVYALYQDVTERNQALTACREMAQKIETIRQEERRRFARDLHDSTYQELASLGWNLNRLMKLAGDNSEPVQSLLRETKLLAEQCSRRIRGAGFFDEHAADVMVRGFLHASTPRDNQAARLTPRETEVLTLLAEGLTSKEIGTQLNISARTAETHRSHIHRKLNFKSLAELIRYAIGRGLVPSV